MALNVGELVAYLRLEGDQFRAGLAAAEGQAGRAQRSLTGLSGAATRVSSALKFVGVAGGVMSVAGVLKSAVTAGMDFTTALNTMQAVSGASASQLQAVSAAARQLGTDSSLAGTSSVDAANAMLELAKGGFTVEQSMQAAKGTLQLAAAAQIEAAEAATIQSQALQAFGLQADYAGKASDILANAANASSAEITDVASALQQSGAVANQFGLSMTDTAASIALMANAGIQGSDAGTLLKSALLALTDTSDPAQTAIKELGLTVYDANGRFAGMETLFGQLQAASKRMTAEQYQAATATLFGSDAMRLSGIAAQQGADGFAKMRVAMDQSGSAAAVAAAKMQGLPGAWENLKNNFEEASLTIYDAIKGPLTAAANGASSAIDGLVSKSKEMAAAISAGLNDPNNKARLSQLVESTRDALTGLVSAAAALGPALGTITASLGKAAAAIGVGAWHVLLTVMQAATGVLQVLEPLLSSVAGLMSNNQVAVTALAAAFVAFKLIPPVMARVTATMAPLAANALSGAAAMGRLATANNAVVQAGRVGAVQMGRFGSSIAQLGQHAPVVARMQSSFLQGAAGADRFGRSAGVAAASMTGLRAAGSSVVSLFGGPLGAAFAAASVAALMLAQQHAENTAKAEAHREAVERLEDSEIGLREALQATRGEMSNEVWSKATGELDSYLETLDTAAAKQKSTWDTLKSVGGVFKLAFHTEDATNDAAKQADEARKAIDDLGMSTEQLSRSVYGSDDQFASLASRLAQTGDSGSLAAAQLSEMRAKFVEQREAARRVTPGFEEAATAVAKLGDETASAADKADALKAAMDAMNPARTVQEATAQYAETIAQVNEQLDQAIDRTQGFGDSLVAANGSIDTFQANGANLHGTLKDMADAAADVAANNGDMGRVNQENEKTFAQLAQQYGVSIDRIRAAYQNLGGSTIDLTMNLRGADTTQQQLGLVYSQLERIQPGQPKTIEVRADDITDQTRVALEQLGYKLEEIDRNGVKTIRISSTAVAVGRELEKLGIQTQALPDGKVRITDTSPEVMARLQQLGVQTETLPDGSVIIKASTDAFWREMQRVTRPETKYVSVVMQNTQGYTPNNGVANVPGAARQFHSAGGWTGPGHKYQEAGIVHADEYVIKKESQNRIERENPGALDYMNRTGQIPTLGGYADGGLVAGSYGLQPGTAISYGGSGFPPWVGELGSKFGVQASTYAGHQESDRGEAGYAPNPQQLNRGIDWSGAVDAMQRFAEYLISVAPQMPQLEQIIWQNPQTGQRIGWAGGKPDTDGSYFAADYSGHTDHVHTRQSAALVEGVNSDQQQQGTLNRPGFVGGSRTCEGWRAWQHLGSTALS
ncbi:phage tail tape measure protein, TP901 family [Gordonia bronchialis DSM 43247]|uniref:Phage tail tape measure protein, TP901 family n=1 Tax=Gordonia bronchialis (strain ATCC 25592 / DSM 43247 / BCRC 13721 / JCM 3198 / KCTC 3076 / NBRC 16047 / NCTC 10667) TaxID=526226 RepID=D0L530_GORB4|nr:phage tail tape measure protein [Gordonia bronchialis]ACY20482.1 phage tail tape measure protein, TP901 family [Gordonia bronchialis DSM 43247]MCC3323253.1 phage tail tape measure protein [Gordonia bronchialis]QGS25735.1 phage tail tape measure protein [Gordonia bronchialis]STQ63287.1 Phage-related minor tail protein [Gordonia bronchialis]STS10885.1 Phage-related minor tail protein [Gordonia bronchialis]